MAAEEAKLKLVIAKKQSIYKRVTKLYDLSKQLVPSLVDTRTKSEFMAMSSNLKCSYEQFSSLCDEHNLLLLQQKPDIEINYNDWDSFETLYTRISHTRTLMSGSNESPSPPADSTPPKCKLPPIELPSFDGNPEHWPLFYESFKTNIHTNNTLSNAQRVQYLVGKLSGKALSVFAGIIPNESNYPIIWDSLITKYQDKRMLGTLYLNNIFESQPPANSPAHLNNFIEKIHSSLSALRQLDISDLADFIVTHIALKKLDLQLVQSFELSLKDKDIPNSSDLICFVRHHIKILERTSTVNNLESTAVNLKSKVRSLPRQSVTKVSHTFALTNNHNRQMSAPASTCGYCNMSNHSQLFNCLAFKKLLVKDRFNFVKQSKLCINCLSAKHSTSYCKSLNTCNVCHKNHHSLLHFDTETGSAARPHATASSARDHRIGTNESVCLHSAFAVHDSVARAQIQNNTTVLPTAQVYVATSDNDNATIRCLIDSASQNNLITLASCKKLNLKIKPLNNTNIKTVGMITTPILGYVPLTIKSRFKEAQYSLLCLVVNQITDYLPTQIINSDFINNFANLPLADDSWNIPGEIHAILGAQLFPHLLLGNKIISTPSLPPSRSADRTNAVQIAPYALETTLGYIIVGQISTMEQTNTTWSFGPLLNENLNNSLMKFWELEQVPTLKNNISSDDRECERLYQSSVTRDPSGRFVVSLPFKGDHTTLGHSHTTARRRLTTLERKFIALPALRQEYNDILSDYIRKGYLSELPSSPSVLADGYFIPHHAVVRPEKTSTKVRIVLDASARTDTGISLNDLLYTGPNLQADLFTLLIRFRQFKIAITADIQQMYLRLMLTETDRKYQKILYRFNENEPIRVFQFNSVAFGLRSSPFLAMRTVRQLAEVERDRFPRAAEVAVRDLYMDDLTTSVNTQAGGVQLAHELIALFKSGGFDLVKWASNSSSLLTQLPESHRAAIEFSDGCDTIKVLGLKWLPVTDTFTFTTGETSQANTKRSILSTIACLFDVLGLVAPVILYAKLLLQELWLAKIDWDEEPPKPIIDRYVEFKNELPLLSHLQIPRHLGISTDCTAHLLGFGDASLKAYGGVIYLHITYPNGDVSVHLVCSKSKVAPLKTISLARLELCAALLLSELVNQVYHILHNRYPIKDIFAFSDSTIALSWIHSSPHRWQTFVANRVSKIQDNLSPDRFFHIPGTENPSDCVSRGLLPSQILNHVLWWHGPMWTHSPISAWPIVPFEPSQTEDVPEVKSSVTLATTLSSQNPLIELALQVSSWKQLLRIIVYVLRFIKKLPKSARFKVSHLEIAERTLLRSLQHEYFCEDIKNVNKGNLPSPALRKLDVFVDGDGLLRVGGRLNNAAIPFGNRHPILLPRRHHIVDLLIDDCHRSNCHTGSHLVMSLLRQRYWIISARNIIRQRIRGCNFCFHAAPKHPSPIMASLPPARVQEAKAFTHTGVDFCGPINITLTRRRGVKSQKAYICLFICLTTKAVHIEIASDLSTETFLDAFKRFLARRGPVSIMYSDNGTNFIGAKRQLDELYDLLSANETSAAFQNEFSSRRIEWRTIPARAPHMGGLWESNIKSMKTHLYRTIGNQLLCYEELLTVLTQIECILNSRPLCLLSDQPHFVLTPAHFLQTTPLQSLPTCELDTTLSLSARKKMLDNLVRGYWKQWRVDYLHTLQLRQKWNTPDVSVSPGTLVLIHQDDVPPLRWPTGIVEQVFPGKDGVVRVASVRTTTGTYKRPVVKLCPLPTQ